MVLSTTWLEFKDMAQDPLVGREPVSASCNRWTNEGLKTEKYGVYPKEHPANCPLRWRLGNDMGVYLSWLQVGLGHHTRTPNLDFSPVDFKRFLTVLADRPLFGNHCLFRRGLVANGIRLTKRYSAPFSSCDVTRDLPDLGNSFSVGLVCFLKSPPTTA
jgi:hypothetical protein